MIICFLFVVIVVTLSISVEPRIRLVHILFFYSSTGMVLNRLNLSRNFESLWKVTKIRSHWSQSFCFC